MNHSLRMSADVLISLLEDRILNNNGCNDESASDNNMQTECQIKQCVKSKCWIYIATELFFRDY